MDVGSYVHSITIWDPFWVPCLSLAVFKSGDDFGQCLVYHVVTEDIYPILGVHRNAIVDYVGGLDTYLLVPFKNMVNYHSWASGGGW